LILIQNQIKADLLFDLDKLESKYDLQWPITTKGLLPLNYFFAVQDKFEITDDEINKWSDSDRGSDELLYKNGLTQLSKFHTYFKNFNDRQSANDVYVKIKDLETGRLETLYKENPSFENFFEVIVIRFLKRFSNYGTSPSKIVISAFQIILLFAFLFLFSSNSWNSVNFKTLNDKIKPSISYFITNNSIESSFRSYKIGQEQYAESQALLTQNKSNIPAVFYFPSITFVKIQNKLTALKLKVWNYFNVVEGSWVDLSRRKKITNSIILSVFLFFFIAFKILVLLLNALTLSINSFTTLGFGEIPIKGLGRHLAILEGFIGWIFLTLFSVTLISQVLS
jgi:hypothetical protein